MSNYTKTTDFEAKDSLPTGDSGKIIRGAEFETEFDAIATAITTKADTAGPTFTGTLTFETISDGTIGVTAFVDEDDMSSDSATLVPTQQSVKAYVDSVTTELQAQDLDFQADSGGALNIDLDTETMTFTGGTGIDTSGSGNTVTFDIDSTVTTLTGTQTLTNKTLTAPAISGNLTTDGTIDGRDVATDGAKLDGIEAGATADQTAAEIRTLVGSATDSNVFTDADHSKLDGIEASATADQTDAEIRAAVEAATDSNVFTDADHTKLDGIEASADVTDTANVTAAGALMDSEVTNLAQVKAFDSSDYATAAQGSTADSAMQDLVDDTTPQLGGDLASNGNDILFADSDKAVFGAGSDLQIYHDGSTSVIKDAGTGELQLQAENNLRFQNLTGSTYAKFTNGAQAELYYGGNLKLATTSTGIDVTGTITADGLNLGDNNVLNVGTIALDTIKGDSDDNTNITFAGSDTTTFTQGGTQRLAVNTQGINVTGTVTADGLTISSATANVADLRRANNTGAGQVLLGNSDGHVRLSGTNGSFDVFNSGNTAQRFGIANNGDISFYEDTGTTAKLFWDASLESLGIGTTSLTPTDGANIELSSSTSSRLLLDNTGASGRKYAITSDTSGNLGFYDYDASAFRILVDSSGNVGIGTSSPATTLTVEGSGANGIELNRNGADATQSARLFFDSSTSGYAVTNVAGALTFSSGATAGVSSGTERMRIDSSGNLLVGKTSSDLTTDGFEVRPTGFVGVRTNGDPLYLNRKSTDGAIATFAKDGSTVGSISSTDNSGIIIGSNDVGLRFRQQSAGAAVFPREPDGSALDATLDLGLSNSRFKDLYLSGSVFADASLNVSNSSGYAAVELGGSSGAFIDMKSPSSDDYDARIITSGTDLELITANGDIILNSSANVGIGVTPSASHYKCLEIGNVGSNITGRGAADTHFMSGLFWDGQSTQEYAVSSVAVGKYQITNGIHYWATAPAGTAGNTATVQTNMMLDVSGNLLVGTTSAGPNVGGLSVDATGSLHCASFQAGGNGYGIVLINSGGTTVGSIVMGASATTFNTSSDQRLKDNIVDAPSASDDIDAIQVRSFDWKADGAHQKYGMVAQELLSVAPEAVSGDADSDDMMGVDYSKLVPMMLKEIQSLRARVAQLEGEA